MEEILPIAPAAPLGGGLISIAGSFLIGKKRGKARKLIATLKRRNRYENGRENWR